MGMNGARHATANTSLTNGHSCSSDSTETIPVYRILLRYAQSQYCHFYHFVVCSCGRLILNGAFIDISIHASALSHLAMPN